MKSILQLLDEVPADESSYDEWYFRVLRALRNTPEAWTSAIDRTGQLSEEHAWILLSWVEIAASKIVRTRSSNDLTAAVFAITLTFHSALDRRDCSVVASLLRRASWLADLDFAASVEEGCKRAGTIGRESRELLIQTPAELPSTHIEKGVGDLFMFERVPVGFDVDDLERWLEGDDNP